MNNWKSIVGGSLAVVAIGTIVASVTLDDSEAHPRSSDQVVFAAATFLSVVILQWLLWRFIIPSDSIAPAHITSFFPLRTQRGFFSGTMTFGYVQVTFYCFELSGYLQRSDLRGRVVLLVMGLSLIGLGTAARLREVFAVLAAANERQKPSA